MIHISKRVIADLRQQIANNEIDGCDNVGELIGNLLNLIEDQANRLSLANAYARDLEVLLEKNGVKNEHL